MDTKQTMFALATAPFNSAIHIIRLSGPDVYRIINQITNKEVKPLGMRIQRVWLIDHNQKKWMMCCCLNLSHLTLTLGKIWLKFRAMAAW